MQCRDRADLRVGSSPGSAGWGWRLRIECLDSLSTDLAARWQGFLAAVAHAHPEQDPVYAPVLGAQGFRPLFVLGWQGDDLAAVGLFGLKPNPALPGCFTFAMAHSGPVCAEVTTMLAFLDGLSLHPALARVGAIRITPYWLDDEAAVLTQRLAGSGWQRFETQNYRATGLTDLTPPADQIMARFARSVRTNIRKAENLGLQAVRVESLSGALTFLARLNDHRAARGLRRIGEAAFLASFRQAYQAGERGFLLAVMQADRLVSGATFHLGWETIHFMNSFHDEALARELGNLRIAPFQVYQAMLLAKARGCRWLDWEGYRPGVPESDPHYRINRYKEDFAPLAVQRLPGHGKVLAGALRGAIHASGTAKERVRPWLKTLLRRGRNFGD